MRQELNAHFRVSPTLLAPLGLEQLQDPALAVLELVKNSWDAGAERVIIEVKTKGTSPNISVTDNGVGMSVPDFRDRWLVIGASHKRDRPRAVAGRPIIGEKGLGRLASYALGNTVTIISASEDGAGFVATVDWGDLLQANSLEDYKISVQPKRCERGTSVVIGQLKAKWTESDTEFLVTHAQFLTSVPGQKFSVSLVVNGRKRPLSNPLKVISRLAEAQLAMSIDPAGVPTIASCVVGGIDETDIAFRAFSSHQLDKRLAGTKLTLRFYRRDSAAKNMGGVLKTNEVIAILERYQGIRVYRDGINVPPYGINGDDWARLEKQRTSTGGPTMVPGNSQLIGEVYIPATASKHFVITAGRSGFADQEIVKSLAHYVRWAVKELGTARRARALGIGAGQGPIPPRVDDSKRKLAAVSDDREALDALKKIASEDAVRSNVELRAQVIRAQEALEDTLDKNEQTLRLYAQLASTGIAATSFAHELRADFDVVSEAVEELSEIQTQPDEELLELLNGSWTRITNFASLFKVLPVKQRRQRRQVSARDLEASIEAVSKLAPTGKVVVEYRISVVRVSLVLAELDSVLLNLVSNAVKAINASPRADEGKISIQLGDVEGQNLEISVADNGCGVSSKVARVLFEPLEGEFSEGTGMGLSIVRFIAERYGGDVRMNSKAPRGYTTQFVATFKDVVR